MNFYELLFNRGQPSGEGMTHFERLFAAKLVGGGEIKELEGVPPLLFKANGEPLIDWSIYGNTVQNGTPTPDSPIMPEGCGERTGNLFDFEQLKNAPSGTIGSVTFSHVLTLQLKANTYYTMSSNGTGSANLTPADLYRSAYFNATTGESSVNKNNPVTVLTDSTGIVRIGFFSERTNAQQYLSGEAQLWINEGSIPLPYENFGYKIPISMGGTTNNVYLGEVQTERQIRKFVLTGSEGGTWSYNATIRNGNGFFNANIFTGYKPNVGAGYCTHYPLATAISDTIGVFFSGNINFITDFAEGIDTADKWKSYLQQQYANGTPVTVWYVLATPQTAVVNEPLMKIGDYADSLTATQAGTEIATVKGSNTLDIDTTVKPSNVYIKYKD